LLVAVELNHTIVNVRDRAAGATFLADILGVPVGEPSGPFIPVRLSNGVTLDYHENPSATPQHYAFLVGETEFDAAYQRILDARVPYWADPFHNQPNQLNDYLGGRGLYFEDPDGHNMEILTRAE
jgi:catechol 2,3-dioxygenase-like lactoylglutathione lyase family enzyme